MEQPCRTASTLQCGPPVRGRQHAVGLCQGSAESGYRDPWAWLESYGRRRNKPGSHQSEPVVVVAIVPFNGVWCQHNVNRSTFCGKCTISYQSFLAFLRIQPPLLDCVHPFGYLPVSLAHASASSGVCGSRFGGVVEHSLRGSSEQAMSGTSRETHVVPGVDLAGRDESEFVAGGEDGVLVDEVAVTVFSHTSRKRSALARTSFGPRCSSRTVEDIRVGWGIYSGADPCQNAACSGQTFVNTMTVLVPEYAAAVDWFWDACPTTTPSCSF